MWRNYQVLYFIEWLRKHNDELNAKGKSHYNKTGFYGLDLYSLYRSMEAVICYLEGIDPKAAEKAKKSYACFDHYD
ncbi:hypothetical protein RclHR1_15820007 [Rhizophagus clarus]|uniref:Erythromycin esterase family protein n=1 Tax=Rhizophagus clarus TaxID=94130 RepID=A0A2Z6QWM4_9GLOM|nr:hypothetical protein RclHR1_15820007 [Rhizophagus clarus]GES76875.1 erythromycin esterase family protein [Rhizophagus clarus]